MQAAETHDPGGTGQPTTDDDLPELGDESRWSGDVVETRTDTLEWGTYEFFIEGWFYSDGRSSLTIAAPEEPVPAAEELIADWLNNYTDAHSLAAATLADGWGIDIEEVRR